MAATRSRTDRWKEYLSRIRDRGGTIELSVARRNVWVPSQDASVPQAGADLVWRVRLIEYDGTRMIVEPPAAFGRTLRLDPDVELVGAMTVGQNRWMFQTRTLGTCVGRDGSEALSIAVPATVERCTRRQAHRMSTADLKLADVRCWPLRDPRSVVAGEAANRGQITQAIGDGAVEQDDQIESLVLPDVGPMFSAKMVNISGGGLGIQVARDESQGVERCPFLWLRIDLRPQIPLPLAVTARIAHTHRDLTQDLYAGLAFDFTHNPEHRAFVVELLGGYVQSLQEDQRQRLAQTG